MTGRKPDFTKAIFDKKQIDAINKKKFKLIEKALEDAILTSNSKIVVIRLLTKHYNNGTGRCDPAEKTLAADLKLSERTVRYAIKQLKDGGWLSIQRRFDASNQYQFNWERQTLPVGGEAKNDRTRGKLRHDLRQKTTGPEANSCRLTIERTIEGTNQRTTQEGVCDSLDSSLTERSSQMQDSNLTVKKSFQGECNSSEEDDDLLALFAHLAEDDVPSQKKYISSFQEKDICPPVAPVVSAADLLPILQISDPRGELKWIPDAGKEPIKRWLVSKRMNRKYVDSLQWKEIMACYNDVTDVTIQSHCNKQHSNKAPVMDPDERPLPDAAELRCLRSRKSDLEQIFDDDNQTWGKYGW